MNTRSTGRNTGTSDPGVLERTMELLRLLATAGRYGLALTQISEAAKLPHSTTHRLLHRLIAERMVVQRESSRRYILGPLSFELGLAASQFYDLREPSRPILTRLAEDVGDTVYLTVRSGGEGVCEDRYEGPSPIRVITLEVGSRRPLGLGAGGLAILSALSDDERERAIGHLTPLFNIYKSLQEKTLRKAIDTCQRQGFSLVRSQVTLGTTAIGVAIRDTLGNPIAAVSVAAVNNRMPDTRVTALSQQVIFAVTQIKDSLQSFPYRY